MPFAETDKYSLNPLNQVYVFNQKNHPRTCRNDQKANPGMMRRTNLNALKNKTDFKTA